MTIAICESKELLLFGFNGHAVIQSDSVTMLQPWFQTKAESNP